MGLRTRCPAPIGGTRHARSPARLEASSFTALRRAELIVLFGVLTVFTPFAVDMYMPAMPTIAREFHAPTAAIEHSLASYFLGLAVGQAVVGPLSDRFGRKLPLLIGLVLYVVGSLACALAPGPLTLDTARFFQATGGCAGTVLARACVRDIYPPGDASRIFAQMLLILAVSPLFAPLFGGWMMLVADWRWIFWGAGGTGAAGLAVGGPAAAGNPSRLRPRHPSGGGGARLLGHRQRQMFSSAMCCRPPSPAPGFMSISPNGRMW